MHGQHADAPTNLMSEVCMELWSFYFRWLPVYYTRYQVLTLYPISSAVLYQVPRVNQPFIKHDIRTYQVHACTRWIHLMRDTPSDAPSSDFRYTLAKSSESSVVGLLDRAHIYAAPIRVQWRAIPYDYVFRSSTTNTLSVLYYANALWLVLRLIQPGVVYTGTRTDNPYWQVRSIGRKHADEHVWLCLTSHIRVIFAVRLWYYCCLSIIVFFTFMLHVV